MRPARIAGLWRKAGVAKPWWNPARWAAGAVQMGPPADASVQMLWSNMALHMAADPQDLIGRWHLALAVDGYLMFSCLGPDTLRELHGVYAAMGWPPAGVCLHRYARLGRHAGARRFCRAGDGHGAHHAHFCHARAAGSELRELGANLHPDRSLIARTALVRSTKCCLSVWPIRARKVSWH